MNEKRKFLILCLAGILLVLGIGYAYVYGNLKIDGEAMYRRSNWDIHFLTPTVINGSVTGESVTTPATVTGTNADTVEYSITLTNPKDYYEFTVPIKNEGTLDAMISTISNKLYTGTTEIEIPDYLEYVIKYDNGADLESKQLLRANETQTIRVKVYFRDDIDVSQLPNADTNLSFKFKINYIQADNTAKEIVAAGFNDETSWSDFISGIRSGDINPTVGETKKITLSIDLDNDSIPEEHEYSLRVLNTSTPAECSTPGFSQTACGLVLEFVDAITDFRMNSTNTNVGGWSATEARTYLNQTIYNALPSSLKNAIIDTTVVSGHGSTEGETNFTSTDKLYLLSTKEVGLDENFDSAKEETRTMDYYVTHNNEANRIKTLNNTNIIWWLRSAQSQDYNHFYAISETGSAYVSNATDSYNLTPAFRIA